MTRQTVCAKRVYQIKEFGSFITGKEAAGYVTLPKCIFEQLENFILTSRNGGAHEFMGISARRGVGKIITAKNYVGVITMQDGAVIEIMPKIYSAVSDGGNGALTKKLFIDMLKTLRKMPYKIMQRSHVNVVRMNIFELFIRMFLDEVFSIVKRGIKCGYETVEENSSFVRGKILIQRQIKINHSHKERVCAAHDTFGADRPENRVIKAALIFLSTRSSSSRNRNDIKTLLEYFSGAAPSINYSYDFSKCDQDGRRKDYSTALSWSRVFLSGSTFSPFFGDETVTAQLFPMETLFESYTAEIVKKLLDTENFEVSVQDRSFHLFDEPEKKFQMKPDIVVRRMPDGAVFIFDTKWKLLDESRQNWGISQSDMYQMFAYHKKYAAQSVSLIYPQTPAFPSGRTIRFKSDDAAAVNVYFVDLFDMKNSVAKITSELTPQP